MAGQVYETDEKVPTKSQVYRDLTAFYAAGGPLTYGTGEVWIAGRAYWSNGRVVAPSGRVKKNQSIFKLGGSIGAAGSPAPQTWHLTKAMDSPFTHAAMLLESGETATKLVDKIAFASASTMTGFPHSANTWVAGAYAGSASGTMPIRIDLNVPSLLISDFALVASQEPTDGTTNYYLAGRAYFATTTGYSFRAFTNIEAAAAAFNGRISRAVNQGLDGITTPANFTASFSSPNNVIAGFITLNANESVSICSFGDSTQAGYGSTTDQASAAVRAAYAAVTKDKKISIGNFGYSGAVPSTYLQIAKNAIPLLKPNYAIFRVSSINEPVASATIADRHYGYCMDFYNTCQLNSVIPIFEGCLPQNFTTLATDQYRQALNQRVANFCEALGIAYIDLNSVATAEPTPWLLKAEYDSNNPSPGTHPNDAGYSAMAQLYLNVMGLL